MWSYPADSSEPGYHHSAALALNQPLFFLWLVLIAFAKAIATEQEDLGVFHQTVGNGGRDGGVVKNVAPFGEGRVGGDDGGALVTVTGGDHLKEQVGGLLIERQVTQFVD